MNKATNVHWHSGNLTREERWRALKARGATLWFTGLSASGKSTIASALERARLDLATRLRVRRVTRLRHRTRGTSVRTIRGCE